MNQHEFILVSKNIPGLLVTQDYEGKVNVTLSDNIIIVHDYKKRNIIEITFKKEESKFLVPDKKSLKEIYEIFLLNVSEDRDRFIHKFCIENLSMR